MNGLLQDLRQAARAFAGSPGLSLAAVATLALGIGASAAIFSAVDAVLIHPLPYADQDRLVVMWQTDPAKAPALSRLVESQLFGLSAADPATAATAIAILVAVTAAAGYNPVRRATLVEPMKALRHE